MTDNTMDGGQTSGVDGLPSSPASTGQASGSPGGVTLEAALKDLNDLKATVRSLQSDKDKGVAKVAKEVKSLAEQFERYEKLKAKGYDTEEITRQFELDAILAERSQASQSQVSQTQPGGSVQSVTGVGTDDIILKSLSIDPNSAEVTAILRAHPEDAPARLSAYAGLLQKRATDQARPANPAQVMSGGGGMGVPDEMGALTAKLKQLQANPSANMKEIKAVGARLEQLIKQK